MKLLVVTGPVSTSIDFVRAITNVASGKTGLAIATEAARRGHSGVLLTSIPPSLKLTEWELIQFKEFNDLQIKLEALIRSKPFDAIVMAAAICDYVVSGYSPDRNGEIRSAQGKISGHLSELWLRLVPAPRLVNLIRESWGYKGKLIIFKLEAALSINELFSRAESTRSRCGANIVVANLLESAEVEAWLGPSKEGGYHHVQRECLPFVLLDAIESGAIS